MSLSVGGDSSGDFTGAAGTTLAFAGGTHTLAASADITAGNLTVSNGILNHAGAYTVSGTTRVSGGTANLTGTLNDLGDTLIVSGGTLNASGVGAPAALNATTLTGGVAILNALAFNTGTYTQSGGTLGGTGSLTVSGAATLSGGVMTGAGTTTLQGTTALTTLGLGLDGGRVLRNEGTVNWVGGDVDMNAFSNTGGSGRIDNAVGGLFDAQGNNSIVATGFADVLTLVGFPAFNNAGTFRKSGGTGTTSVAVAFNNSGTVDLQSGTLNFTADVNQHVGSTLTGGKWKVSGSGSLNLNEPGAVNILNNQGDVTLNGAAASFARINSLTSNQGAFRLLGNRNFTAGGPFTNSGVLQLAGGAFAAPSFSNTGTGEVFGFGTVTPTILNSGLVRAAGGTLNASGGIDGQSGTIQTDTGGTLTLGANSDGDFLINNGNLALGAFNLTVEEDYTNANFGTGNAFNARSNVTGSGQIRAGGDVAQALIGQVSNGGTGTPSLAFGNIHVNDVVTRTFQIANTGTTGPSLRGALQTSVNGGNVTDSRLSGSGTSAADFGPIETGTNSGNLEVIFTGSSAGALVNQRVAVVNNFDNVGDQVLSFSGAVYRLAAANPIAPVEFGNVHVGDVVSKTLSVTNAAANDGFSETLNASFDGVSDARILASGSITQLAAQATDATGLVIGLDTSSAGSIDGFATVKLVSDGAGLSGLGLTELTSQNVGVSTNIAVYRYAAGLIQNAQPIDFGAFRVGDTADTVDLAIRNDVANDGFSERLNASAGTADDGFTVTGEFNLLSAGANNTGGLKVGIETTVAGIKNGAATVSLVSDGAGTSNLGQTALLHQSVTLKGRVYARASADVQTPAIDFGIVHVGDTVSARSIAVKNDASGALTDALRRSVAATPAGFTANGSLGADGLAAGATSSALQVGLNTSTAGSFSGNAILAFASHNPDMTDLSLLDRHVSLVAQVNNFANPVLSKTGGNGTLLQDGATFTYDFGRLTLGAGEVLGSLQLTNLVSGPADTLGADFSVGSGPFALTGFENFSGLDAGSSHSFSVSFDPLAEGFFEHVVSIDLYGQNASGFLGGLGAINVTFRAEVAPVPVPAAVWMLASGLVGLWRARRLAT